jgi:signal transduction histidine kinase
MEGRQMRSWGESIEPIDEAQGLLLAMVPGNLRKDYLTGELRNILDIQVTEGLPTRELLRRLIGLARDVVGALYAALAVISEGGYLEPLIYVDQGSEFTITEAPDAGLDVLQILAEHPEPILVTPGRPDQRWPVSSSGTTGPASFLAVPIRSKDQVVGGLYLTGRAFSEFSEVDETLMLTWAATAGFLLEQARLSDQARTRLEWLKAGTSVTRTLLTHRGAADPLQLITDAVYELGDADMVLALIPGDELAWIHVAAASVIGPPAAAAGLRLLQYRMTSRSLIIEAMRQGAVAINSVRDLRHEVVDEIRKVVDIGPVIVAPLSSELPLGVLVIGRVFGRPTFSRQDVEMAELFGNQAALAREIVTARSHGSQLLMLEDRERVARELTDNVIQRLFSAGLSLQTINATTTDPAVTERIDRLVAEIDDISRNIRRTIFHFEGHELTYQGLVQAVRTAIQPLVAGLDFEPVFTGSAPPDLLVPGPLTAGVVDVVFEAARMAAEQSEVTELVIDLSVSDEVMTLEVLDNGTGHSHDPGDPAFDKVRGTAAQFGGSWSITERPTGGTRLLWTVPSNWDRKESVFDRIERTRQES